MSAATTDVDTLRERISAILSREGVNGAGVVLANRDQVIWAGGVGLADAETGRTVTAETPFRLGSISKSLTALAVMRFVERGQLSLDARLRDVAPEVEFDNPWEASDPVRIAQLLEHTAGFEFVRFNDDLDHEPEPRSLLAALGVNPRARHSRWPPGTRMSYSNEGYLAVGYVLEKLSGRSFDDVMAAEIFTPLGMDHSAFRLTPQVADSLAQGYGDHGRPEPYLEDMQRPAANLIASPNDMARYLRLWLRHGEHDGQRLLSPDGATRIETRGTLPYTGPEEQYGLGNQVIQEDGFIGRGHLGFTGGFNASLRYFPREGVGWVLMLNSAEAYRARSDIESQLLEFLMRGQTRPEPARFQAADAALRQLVGFYRDVTPAQEISAALTAIFSGTEVALKDGQLWERSRGVQGPRGLVAEVPWRRLVPVGDDAFRHDDETVSSFYFTRTDDRRRAIVKPDGYLEEEPGWLATAKWGLFATALFGLLSALALSPLLLMVALLNRSTPLVLWIAIPPFLAALMAVGFWALFTRSPQLLGQVNSTTVGIFVLSCAFPLLAVMSLMVSGVALATPAGEVGILAKTYALTMATLCCGCALFAWSAQWIALRTWSW